MLNSEKSPKSKKVKWWSFKKTPPKSKQYDWLKVNQAIDKKE